LKLKSLRLRRGWARVRAEPVRAGGWSGASHHHGHRAVLVWGLFCLAKSSPSVSLRSTFAHRLQGQCEACGVSQAPDAHTSLDLTLKHHAAALPLDCAGLVLGGPVALRANSARSIRSNELSKGASSSRAQYSCAGNALDKHHRHTYHNYHLLFATRARKTRMMSISRGQGARAL